MSDKNPLKKSVKTKKNKKYKKSNLWKIIDEEENSSQKVEIIYEKDNVIDTNICQTCQQALYYTDSGFLLC